MRKIVNNTGTKRPGLQKKNKKCTRQKEKETQRKTKTKTENSEKKKMKAG